MTYLDVSLISRIAAYVPALVLLGLLGLGCYLSYVSIILTIRGQKVMAYCVEKETTHSGSGSDRSTTTSWTVAYETRDGKQYKRAVNAGFEGLEEGGVIEVLYDPFAPGRVEVNSPLALWLYPGLTGLLFMAWLIFVGRRWLQQRPKRGASSPVVSEEKT